MTLDEIKERKKHFIKIDLLNLIDEAEKTNQIIKSHYKDILFTPAELRIEIINDRFIWGRKNWSLVSAQDEFQKIQKEIDALSVKAKEFIKKYKLNANFYWTEEIDGD